MFIESTSVTNRLGGRRIGINRHPKFAAENFQSANVIPVLVGQQNAIQLFRRHSALLQSADQLASAQPAIHQNFAVASGNQSGISGAAATPPRRENVPRGRATGLFEEKGPAGPTDSQRAGTRPGDTARP